MWRTFCEGDLEYNSSLTKLIEHDVGDVEDSDIHFTGTVQEIIVFRYDILNYFYFFYMLKTFTYTKIKQCYICNSKKLEKISNIYSSSIPNFKSYLFLCKSCGYGFLNPQPDNRSYKKINEIWYKKKFSINQKHNEPKILNRHKKTLHRLNKLKILIKPQTKILDIGAGYGQLFDEIKKVYKKTNYYALEQFQEAIDVIKNITSFSTVAFNLFKDKVFSR